MLRSRQPCYRSGHRNPDDKATGVSPGWTASLLLLFVPLTVYPYLERTSHGPSLHSGQSRQRTGKPGKSEAKRGDNDDALA